MTATTDTPAAQVPIATVPTTIAGITDPRLRVVVRALVTVVEEADTRETGHPGGLTVEQAWDDLDDDRETVLAAAQACIDALDALATSEAPLLSAESDGGHR